jgi:hypothetical protein
MHRLSVEKPRETESHMVQADEGTSEREEEKENSESHDKLGEIFSLAWLCVGHGFSW